MNLSRYKTSTILTFIALAILLLVNGIFILTTNHFFRKEAITEAKVQAKLILDKNLSVHDYFTNMLKPDLFETLKDTIAPGEYFDPLWMSSTHALGYMEQYFSKRNDFGYYYKDAAINARNLKNEADSIERIFLREVNEDSTVQEQSGITSFGEKKYYYVMERGESLDKSCMRCHDTPQIAPKGLVDLFGKEKSFHRKEGEVISVVSIRIPLNEAFQRAKHDLWIISIIVSAAILFSFISLILLQRHLVIRPISLLQKRAMDIAVDNSLLGETIAVSATKDLSNLVDSFNIMSHKLHDSRKNLEDKVKEKTAGLEQKIIEVKELNDTKDKLLSILAHDLRNPLSTILGFSGLLSNNLQKYDRQKIGQQVKIIHDVSFQAYELLDELLLWSKSQSGTMQFDPEQIVVLDLIQEYVSQLNANAVAKNIELAVSVPGNITVTADRNMLKLILRNLLSNAIKFTQEGGHVIIRAERQRKETIFSVEDTGVGIEKENLEHIWEISKKFISSGTANEAGTGFGLVLCKEFVERHGGKIRVISYPGKGSTFSFTIPDKQ
ncbi:MAG TPA: DUF3365 domain-containing protein [Bacteroidales bacterium]|nr:DUF3365 domain-containing protein [Bacteroidales bacterium]